MRGILAALMLCLGFVCASGSSGVALEFQGEMLTAVGGPVSGPVMKARPASARGQGHVSRTQGYRTASRHDARTGGLPSRSGGASGEIQIVAPGLVAEARRHLGATARDLGLPAHLWCADFLNRVVLPRVGLRGTGSRAARSFASFGVRVSGPQVGAIAVMARGGRGGHVGIVSGIDEHGNPIIISGNHDRRVAETVYPRGRVYAYVVPS